jgi:hypothetical protein
MTRENRQRQINRENSECMSNKELGRSKQYDHVQSKVKQQLDQVRV